MPTVMFTICASLLGGVFLLELLMREMIARIRALAVSLGDHSVDGIFGTVVEDG